MEEQKTKQFEELNKYERAMATASLENKLEAMLNDLQQMALALHISISLDATFHDFGDPHTSGAASFVGEEVTRRVLAAPGDFFGIIEEALAKKKAEND